MPSHQMRRKGQNEEGTKRQYDRFGDGDARSDLKIEDLGLKVRTGSSEMSIKGVIENSRKEIKTRAPSE